ncbi:MAG: pseudouridine synthase [Chitinophagaceae bacterium]
MSKNQQFQKFITYKSNAAKKEEFKQEKRSVKKERAQAIDKRFDEKRQAKASEQGRDAKSDNPEPKLRMNKAEIKGLRLNKQLKAESAPVQMPATGKKATGKPVRPPKPGSREEKNLLAGRAATDGKLTVKPPAENGRKTAAVTPPVQPGQLAAAPVTLAQKSALMPLNKYVAHSGVCSRRDAADLIRKGEVRVNDVVVTEPGTKVSQKDTISIKGKKITPSKNLVYILLNKPKDYITTLDDPEGRKTVLDLIKRATDERVYPVGRLDRNTSGVLLITNDGDLAQTLSHPSNLIKKIYEVRLDKPLTKADFEKLLNGIQLEDGLITPDALGYTDPKDKTIIGIEIHSGRNRIVRRIFEQLGYDVRNLDRVTYAGLTKKNVQRGKWRMLTEKEVRILRHFNPQTKTDKVKKANMPVAKKIAKQ